MTGYESKRAAAQDKLIDYDALSQKQLASIKRDMRISLEDAAVRATHKVMAELETEQEPVAYDKTEMNGFVQDLYDKKMQEGKHGHYETMFHVVHQAIKRATPPQRPWVGLTDEEAQWLYDNCRTPSNLIDMVETMLKEKNNAA